MKKTSLSRVLSNIQKTRLFLILDKRGVRIKVGIPENFGINMLFTIVKRQKSPLYKQLENYLITRRGQYGVFLTNHEYRDHIAKFLEITGVQNVEDISDGEMEDYIQATERIYKTSTQRLSAATAVKGFMRYLDQKDKEGRRGKVGRPEKYERNMEMVALRRFDPSTYTIEVLAGKFKITKRAVWEIVKRYETKDRSIDK